MCCGKRIGESVGDDMTAKGQAWSMDLIIGVLIFMLAVGIIYTLLTSKDNEDTLPLRIESEIIASKLTNEPMPFPNNPEIANIASNNQLDQQALYNLANLSSTNYTELKAQLGVNYEFCIYVQDKNGNLVYLQDPNDPSGKKFTGIGPGGIGSNELNLSGTPCGKKV